jgi:hypothetical protein
MRSARWRAKARYDGSKIELDVVGVPHVPSGIDGPDLWSVLGNDPQSGATADVGARAHVGQDLVR